MLRQTFQSEQVHLGEPQRWLDHGWELRLAAVNGTIYKVGLEAKAANRQEAVELSTIVYAALQQSLGDPIQQSDGVFLWDADDGNAVLQLASLGGDRRVMVFFTSSIARSFDVL